MEGADRLHREGTLRGMKSTGILLVLLVQCMVQNTVQEDWKRYQSSADFR